MIQLQKCLCGLKPKIRKKEVILGVNYWWVFCDCGQYTFATREKEFCTELWNSAINKKNKEKCIP